MKQRVRALVVDDEPIICVTLRRELESRFDVDATTSGAEALTMLRSNDYALVLCDLFMRGLSGFELLDVLQREAPHLLSRIVLITGRICSAEELRRFADLGVQLLYKPFGSNELLMLALGYLARAEEKGVS
jgi:CheY-like chemotaxis protein